MLTTRAARILPGCLGILAVTLSACAPVTTPAAPAPSETATASVASPSVTATTSPSATLTPSATVTPTSSTSPSTTFTGDPAVLIPGRNHIGAASDYVYPAELVQQWLEGEVKPTEKIVFLTFDDGPNHSTTPVILDALEKAGAHATFFVVGSMLDEAPELLKQEIAQGNSVSLHSWSHDYKKLYPGRHGDEDRIADEYTKTLAKVREILGPDFNTESWRYPGGHMSWKGLSPADEYLKSQGVSWIDWNADTRDSAPKKERPTTIDALVHNATAPIRDGYHVAVILGHDTPDKALTSKSVPAMIEAYKAAGFKFGVIS